MQSVEALLDCALNGFLIFPGDDVEIKFDDENYKRPG
jgi:hypothetical protein